MSLKTYRFKFNKELLSNIREFSKLHNHDSCTEFLEAFNMWIYENKKIINNEDNRLKNLGFKGDIEKKIYKSARYYFKNKTNKSSPIKISSNEPIPYIPRNKSLFKTMEDYINKYPIKASILFKQFMNDSDENIQLQINTEKKRLYSFSLNEEMCVKKIHKTFNNAYYKIKKKNNK